MALRGDERLPNASSEAADEEADYDPNLVSKSTVAYERNGAVISNPRLLTRDGRVVNCLVGGGRYRLSYDVEFEKDCSDVRFYTLMKTVTGVELGGGVYPASGHEGLYMSAREKVEISFEFKCTLNSGTYFFNCGLGGNGSQSLHRIIDALPFRVLMKNNAHSFGIVSFDYKPKLKLHTLENRGGP